MRVLALLLVLLAALPAEAQRVCQQVGQAVQCRDGTYLPKAQTKPPPKDGTFQYHSDGTVCQVFGRSRYCR
ncbi:MAG TPA: hypothetical protein VEC14_08790 [Reyranellaceae bacterium]|nr:hypothetical protein [Reyranellaceae bacterium]